MIRVRCIYSAGLLRGLGVKVLEEMKIIDKLSDIVNSSKKRDMKDLDNNLRYFVVAMLEALWEVFGRLLEPEAKRIIDLLM